MAMPTKTRATRVSSVRSGTSTSTQCPKTASAEAKSAPKTTTASTLSSTVRTIAHQRCAWPRRLRERPSQGNPRSAARGHAATALIRAETEETGTMARTISSPPTRMDSGVSHSAARRVGRAARPQPRAMTHHVSQPRRREFSTMLAPAASRTRLQARPTLRSGSRRAASAPTPAARATSRGRPTSACSGQALEKRPSMVGGGARLRGPDPAQGDGAMAVAAAPWVTGAGGPCAGTCGGWLG